MAKELAEVMQDALALPAQQREDLLEILTALQNPVQNDREEGVAQAWMEEAARRADAIDAGLVQTIPWEEVSDHLRSLLRR